MSSFSPPVSRNIALAILLIMIGTVHLGIVIRYSVPNAEDFALSVAPRQVGTVTSTIGLLTFEDARFTANLMQGFNVLTLGLYRQFWVMAVLTLVCLWLAMTFFLASIFWSENASFRLYIASALVVFAFYSNAPSLSYGLLYMSSTFTYIWPATLWLVWSGCLLRLFASTGTRHVVFSTVGLVCLLFSYGCSELFILLNPMSLAVFALAAPNGWRWHVPDLIPFAIVSMAAVLFVFYCPADRFTTENIAGDLAARYPETNFATHGVKVFLITLIRVFLSPFTLLSILVFSRLLTTFSLRNTLSPPSDGRVFAALFMAWQVIACIVTLGYYLSQGSIGWDYGHHGRALNVVVMVSLIGVMVTAVIILPTVSRVWGRERFKYAIGVVTVSLAASSVVFPGSSYTMIRQEFCEGTLELNWVAHHNFYRDVEKAVLEEGRPTVVWFSMPDTIPLSVFPPDRDLLPNRDNEIWNRAYEEYFGVDEVRVVGDTIFKR